MPDQVDLTADALAALSLHQQQQQQQQRAAAPSDSASTHDWSAMTDEENAAFSSSLVSSFVMLPSSFGAASSAQKILFYPSLVYNFQLRSALEVPASIKQCKELLRTIHINMRDFLDAVRQGLELTTIPRFSSKTQLRIAMLAQRKFCKLAKAKAEMLQPFLITVRY